MTREHYLSLLEKLDGAVLDLGQQISLKINEAVEGLGHRDVLLAKELIEGDREVDRMRHHIDEQAFVIIATQQPVASDLRLVTASFNVAGELERMGDYCAGIAKLTLQMVDEPLGGHIEDIHEMSNITRHLLSEALQAFKDRDVEAAAEIWRRDEEVDDLYRDFFQLAISEMADDQSTVRRDTYLLWVAHNIERMADRVTNITESVAFICTGDQASFRESARAHLMPN
jgi:phosphate transport system protein